MPTPTVTLSPSGPIQGAMVGSPQVIKCTVSTVSGVESSSVTISWMGPGGVSITNDSIVTISPTTSSGNNYTSSLQFTYLMEGDEGTYTCNVMIFNASASETVQLQTLTSKLYFICFSIIILSSIVPTPSVAVADPNTQLVGQSLTLQCVVTTVRGITSTVDIVWSSDGTVVQRMDSVTLSMMDDSLTYTDSYTISQLSLAYDDRVIQCQVVINASPPVMAIDSITLDVIGE